MSKTWTFTVSSALSAPRQAVWAHACTLRGVNRELLPLARMTYPASISALTEETVPLGQRLFRSWIFALGVIPIDYDDITLTALTPGTGFQEDSTMLSQRVWRHRRTLTDIAGGCCITDELEFVPRVALLAPVFHWVFRLAFRFRHHNLRRIFGSVPAI